MNHQTTDLHVSPFETLNKDYNFQNPLYFLIENSKLFIFDRLRRKMMKNLLNMKDNEEMLRRISEVSISDRRSRTGRFRS